MGTICLEENLSVAELKSAAKYEKEKIVEKEKVLYALEYSKQDMSTPVTRNGNFIQINKIVRQNLHKQ